MADSRFTYTIHIRATPEQVWQALTDPKLTRQYWFEAVPVCSWQPGAEWKLLAPDKRVADSGQVIEIDPPKRLVLSWRHELMPEFRAEGPTRFTCELEAQGSSVKLSIVHEIAHGDSPLMAAFAEGWPPILSSLKSLLETGQPLEETQRWPDM